MKRAVTSSPHFWSMGAAQCSYWLHWDSAVQCSALQCSRRTQHRSWRRPIHVYSKTGSYFTRSC